MAFISCHLFNHLISLAGINAYFSVMNFLRYFYRAIWLEPILIAAVLLQIISGFALYRKTRKSATSFFEQLHIWTGLYLAFFLLIHVGAIMAGRYWLGLDTNFYFGAAGLNSFPSNLFFVPYYTLAIMAFWGHIAAIHRKKMHRNLFNATPQQQAIALLVLGMAITIAILYGMTRGFQGFDIPKMYQVLVGK